MIEIVGSYDKRSGVQAFWIKTAQNAISEPRSLKSMCSDVTCILGVNT